MHAKLVLTMFAAACAAGSLVAHVPAQATPPKVPLPAAPSTDCDWTMWATDSDLDQHNGSVVHIAWGGQGGSATVGGWHGTIEGPVIVKGTNEIDFSVPYSQSHLDFDGGPDVVDHEKAHYGGFIDPNGTASGTWGNEVNGASGTWSMSPTFKCVSNKPAEAAPPGPGEKPVRCVGGRVLPPGSDCGATPASAAPPEPEKAPTDAIKATFAPPKFGSVTLTVTNSSKLPADCHYEADPFHTERDFAVPANGSTDQTFKGLNLGATYHTVVECRADFNGAPTIIGRVEQDVTF
ncbi:hypothetical protein DVS77_19595 [Mycolicibacterium moriokaense]|nr:hypothetical protein DVS77_19595 [Mycolicibacterium moriokaense]